MARAVFVACPWATDTQPAGAVGIELSVIVPVELDFDTSVLVSVNLVILCTDDARGLAVGFSC